MEPHTGLIENRFLSLLTDQRKAVGLVAWLYSTSHPRFFQLISVPSLLIFKNFLIIGSVIFIFLSFLATQSGLQDLSSPTRDRTHVFCSGSTESYPLNHQGNPLYHLQSAILFSGWNWVAILSAFQHAGRKKSKSCMRDFIFKEVTRGSMHHLPSFMSHFKEGWQMESLAWWPCARLQFESFIVQDQE